MKLYQTSAPGYPTRGFRGHVPMSAELDPAPAPVPEPPKPADPPAPIPIPTPAPKTPEPPAPKPDDAAALIATLKAQQAELDRVLTETKAGQAKQRAAGRRDYIRGMALSVDMRDEALDAILSPLGDIDASTKEGAAKLNKWREENSGFFSAPVPAPKVSLEESVKTIVGGEKNLGRKIFGGRTVLGLITEHARSVDDLFAE